MRAAKLVEACTTNTEMSDLLYAVIEEQGLKKSLDALREYFFVNGNSIEIKVFAHAIFELNEELQRGEKDL